MRMSLQLFDKHLSTPCGTVIKERDPVYNHICSEVFQDQTILYILWVHLLVFRTTSGHTTHIVAFSQLLDRQILEKAAEV